jgi:hypothetical protein
MINETKKTEVVAAIQKEAKLLGSMNSVAKKMGVSAASLSANVTQPRHWHKVSDNLWAQMASALGVSLVSREWNVVATTNLKIMHRTMQDAQREALFMAISEKAGSGKTAAIAEYKAQDADSAVYALQCEEWSRKSFLQRLARELGVGVNKYDAAEALIEHIVRFFKMRSKETLPLLILDEADKLRPSALRFLIVLYNRLEDEVGLVACGTDNLEKEIKKGVRKADKGYDEIDSRLGRSFVHLIGSTRADVDAICVANGIGDPAIQERIWNESNPIRKPIGKGYVAVIEDLRAVKRKIKRERLGLGDN